LNSSFAQQEPVASNLSDTTSSLNSLPTASTFPELLDSSVLAALGVTTQLSPTIIQPSFASSAAEDQLPSPQFATEDAILDAASIFLTSFSTVASVAGTNRSAATQSASTTNSTQLMSVLSFLSSGTTKPTSISSNHAVNVVVETENNSVSAASMAISKNQALLDRHRTSTAVGNTPPRYPSFPSRKQNFTTAAGNYKTHTSGNEKISQSQISSPPRSSKHTPHTSRHETTIPHPSTSEDDEEKTTTYTKTVTSLVTITIPRRGEGYTSSF
jgi:hypothetical protein